MSLSPQQVRILSYASEGYADYQIAHVLIISEWTVRNHWRAIKRRLRAADRTHAVSKALRAGIPLEAPPLVRND